MRAHQLYSFYHLHNITLGLKIFEKRLEDSFITTGFSCWNDGSRRLIRHEESGYHQEAVAAIGNKHSKEKIDEALDKQKKKTKKDNHYMLSAVVDALKLLSRQGLATRGAYKESEEQTSEPNSNTWQVLQLIAKRDSHLEELLKKRTNYTSPDVQNELLSIMSTMVLHTLVKEIQNAGWYTIMIDETPDVSGAEQAVICFR